MLHITKAMGDANVERTVPGRLGAAAGSRLLSLVVLLGLVVGLFAAVAAPTAAAGQQRGSHAAPKAGQHGDLDCAKPTAIRKGKKVVVPAKTVAKLCRLLDDSQAAGAATDGARSGARTSAAASAASGCYGGWGYYGYDDAGFCRLDWYDAAGSWYASTFYDPDFGLAWIGYWDGTWDYAFVN